LVIGHWPKEASQKATKSSNRQRPTNRQNENGPAAPITGSLGGLVLFF
jgi:hypothetical protein